MDKDTIYRQDAIDLFPDDNFIWDTNCGYIAPHFARKMIKELPSAQPEPHWIQCSERLPEPNQYVLISVKGEVDVDWIEIDYTGYGCWYRCMKDVMNVDAWMPLPEPWGRRTK